MPPNNQQPPMNEGIYYLRLNGKVEGPFAIGQIYDLWAARKINSQTQFARFEEMDKWQPLSELTLKISAPKIPAPRQAVTETAAPASRTSRPAASNNTAQSDDYYIPPAVYKRDGDAREPKAKRGKIFSGITSEKALLIFAAASGISTVLGILVTVYFTLLPAPPLGSKEIGDVAVYLAAKQNGILAGVGLILMGGLLLIARQLSMIAYAFGIGETKKSDSKRILE